MTDRTFSKVLDQFTNKKDILVSLYLGGEPTLHPQLCDFIKETKNRGFKKTRIHTNGTILTLGYLKDIFNNGLDSIIFSIDGTNEEDYVRIRGSARNLYNARSAMREALELTKWKYPNVEVGVQCLVGKDNPLILNIELEEFRTQLNPIILAHPHSWINADIPESIPVSSQEPPCLFLRAYMAVNVHGDYLLCCRCLNSEKILGSVYSIDPETIWDQNMKQFRMAQIQGITIAPCCTCDAYIKR